jgi:SAM-dependent methyltransferase
VVNPSFSSLLYFRILKGMGNQEHSWSEVAGDYEDEFIDPYRGDVHSPLLKTLGRLATPENRVVADLGCGIGPLLPFLAGHFQQVIAVDFAEGMLKRARERCQGLNNVEFAQRSLTDLSSLAGAVDVAVSVNSLVMPDVGDLETCLQQIRECLRPGGVFVGILPAMDAVHYFTMLLLDRARQTGMGLKQARKNAAANADHEMYDFAFGQFRYRGLEQHFWQPFEIPYRLSCRGSSSRAGKSCRGTRRRGTGSCGRSAIDRRADGGGRLNLRGGPPLGDHGRDELPQRLLVQIRGNGAHRAVGEEDMETIRQHPAQPGQGLGGIENQLPRLRPLGRDLTLDDQDRVGAAGSHVGEAAALLEIERRPWADEHARVRLPHLPVQPARDEARGVLHEGKCTPRLVAGAVPRLVRPHERMAFPLADVRQNGDAPAQQRGPGLVVAGGGGHGAFLLVVFV